jgi:hypothetical protein
MRTDESRAALYPAATEKSPHPFAGTLTGSLIGVRNLSWVFLGKGCVKASRFFGCGERQSEDEIVETASF